MDLPRDLLRGFPVSGVTQDPKNTVTTEVLSMKGISIYTLKYTKLRSRTTKFSQPVTNLQPLSVHFRQILNARQTNNVLNNQQGGCKREVYFPPVPLKVVQKHHIRKATSFLFEEK